VSRYPSPRYVGIIELAGNGKKDLGAQSLAGKILISKNLEAGNWPQSQNGKECEFPKACSPPIRARAINTDSAHSTSSPASGAETKSALNAGSLGEVIDPSQQGHSLVGRARRWLRRPSGTRVGLCWPPASELAGYFQLSQARKRLVHWPKARFLVGLAEQFRPRRRARTGALSIRGTLPLSVSRGAASRSGLPYRRSRWIFHPGCPRQL
jgi:hypothetical protein